MSKKPVVLMVLDGYGITDKTEGNAIYMANTPVMDKLMAECPYVRGNASGLAVGLPDGQMGNSEVGHMNIGAGRIIYQDLTSITKAIEDGDFFENEAMLEAIENCKKSNSDLHLWGLLSDAGGVSLPSKNGCTYTRSKPCFLQSSKIPYRCVLWLCTPPSDRSPHR